MQLCDFTISFCGEIMFSVTTPLQIMGRERMRGSPRPLFFKDDLCSVWSLPRIFAVIKSLLA